jgi:hypothetical protein
MALFRAMALIPLRANSSTANGALDWNLALCLLISKSIMFAIGALTGAILARIDGGGRARSRAAAYGLAATCSNDMGVGRPVFLLPSSIDRNNDSLAPAHVSPRARADIARTVAVKGSRRPRARRARACTHTHTLVRMGMGLFPQDGAAKGGP